jgi:cbb3-type cytochrome oxidase subunit 3
MKDSFKASTGLLIVLLIVIIGQFTQDRPFIATIGLLLLFLFGMGVFAYYLLPDKKIEANSGAM